MRRIRPFVTVVVVGWGLLLARGDGSWLHAVERTSPSLQLEPGRWTKTHEVGSTGVRFRRQPHGGSCFDSKRGRLVLFGSDTHGRDYANSPLYFSTAAREWTRAYADDPHAAYAVTDEGLPVAGPKQDRPWAMHTFGSVVYDEARDEMIVPIFDDHLVPGRFTNAFAELWPQIKRRPTWVFGFEREAWQALPGDGVSCFPHCAAYDSERRVVVAVKPGGIYELAGEPRRWTRVTRHGFFGWHTNCAYDRGRRAVVVFGSNENSNDVAAYFPHTGEYRRMPTPGTRPPQDQHNPMEFCPEVGRTVVLVDRVEGPTSQTETWLYDLAADAWQRVESATLPFACGMNYNLEYDPAGQALWLVTGGERGRPTEVWALRFTPTTEPVAPPNDGSSQ